MSSSENDESTLDDSSEEDNTDYNEDSFPFIADSKLDIKSDKENVENTVYKKREYINLLENLINYHSLKQKANK